MQEVAVPWRPIVSSWVLSRTVVAVALLAEPKVGLLGWDAVWYRRIANHGYAAIDHQGIRFFPLLPLVARAASLGHDAGPALLLIANASAVATAVLTWRLALRLGLGPDRAARTPWVLALTPASFVLVMGYTEAPFLALLAALCLSCLDRRWTLAAVIGLALGAMRPTGLLVAIPVAMYAGRDRRGWPAVLTPVLGCAAYLTWVGARFGDPTLPYTIQSRHGLRGGLITWPFTGDWWVHLPALLAAAVLLVVCARRLPLPLTAYSMVSLGLAATARALSSFDRYALGTLPLVLAAALLLDDVRVRRAAGLAGALLLAGLAAYCFAGTSPP